MNIRIDASVGKDELMPKNYLLNSRGQHRRKNAQKKITISKSQMDYVVLNVQNKSGDPNRENPVTQKYCTNFFRLTKAQLGGPGTIILVEEINVSYILVQSFNFILQMISPFNLYKCNCISKLFFFSHLRLRSHPRRDLKYIVHVFEQN